MEQTKVSLDTKHFTKLASGELLIEDSHAHCKELLQSLEEMKLYIIPMGIDPADPKNSTVRKGPYLLPSLATNHLLRKLADNSQPISCCNSLEQSVFDKLTRDGYFVTEEQNFGARFAVYDGSPNIVNNHAKFLVFTQPDAKLYMISRIATLLKKKAVWATWGQDLQGQREVQFIVIDRLTSDKEEGSYNRTRK